VRPCPDRVFLIFFGGSLLDSGLLLDRLEVLLSRSVLWRVSMCPSHGGLSLSDERILWVVRFPAVSDIPFVWRMGVSNMSMVSLVEVVISSKFFMVVSAVPISVVILPASVVAIPVSVVTLIVSMCKVSVSVEVVVMCVPGKMMTL
jgi:hypothetical protein